LQKSNRVFGYEDGEEDKDKNGRLDEGESDLADPHSIPSLPETKDGVVDQMKINYILSCGISFKGCFVLCCFVPNFSANIIEEKEEGRGEDK
jgi:hypothetical protein